MRRNTALTIKDDIGGHKVFLTIGFSPRTGLPCEIFLDVSKENTQLRTTFQMFAMAVSVALQSGASLVRIVRLLDNTDIPQMQGSSSYQSVFDFIAKQLSEYIPMIKPVVENYAKQIKELLPETKVEVVNFSKRSTEMYNEWGIVVDGFQINEPEGFIQGLRSSRLDKQKPSETPTDNPE